MNIKANYTHQGCALCQAQAMLKVVNIEIALVWQVESLDELFSRAEIDTREEPLSNGDGHRELVRVATP